MCLITQVSVLKHVSVRSAVASLERVGACHLNINWVLCRNLKSCVRVALEREDYAPKPDTKTNIFSTTIRVMAESFCAESAALMKGPSPGSNMDLMSSL